MTSSFYLVLFYWIMSVQRVESLCLCLFLVTFLWLLSLILVLFCSNVLVFVLFYYTFIISLYFTLHFLRRDRKRWIWMGGDHYRRVGCNHTRRPTVSTNMDSWEIPVTESPTKEHTWARLRTPGTSVADVLLGLHVGPKNWNRDVPKAVAWLWNLFPNMATSVREVHLILQRTNMSELGGHQGNPNFQRRGEGIGKGLCEGRTKKGQHLRCKQINK